jgi:hypothetical protein
MLTIISLRRKVFDSLHQVRDSVQGKNGVTTMGAFWQYFFDFFGLELKNGTEQARFEDRRGGGWIRRFHLARIPAGSRTVHHR